MKPELAYDTWADQYDTNENRTRDLEAQAIRTALANLSFNNCLEIGCGTGKNTVWLKERTKQITAVDLSNAMLNKAKEKLQSHYIEFIQADINEDWQFVNDSYDLISFSLVLEHIENLEHIFKEAFKVLNPGGYVYIGELHPFKQYSGSKARFETEDGLQVVQCFNHHISDFVNAAKKFSLSLVDLYEFFDNDDRSSVPRILTLVLQKSEK